MGGFVYILKSEKNGKFYVGSTKNLKDRLNRHFTGRVRTTKDWRPLKLVFYKPYPTFREALLKNFNPLVRNFLFRKRGVAQW